MLEMTQIIADKCRSNHRGVANSIVAAAHASVKAGSVAWWVMVALGENDGLTYEELAARMGRRISSVQPRISDLKNKLFYVTEKRGPNGLPVMRPSESGNPAALWVLTDSGRSFLAGGVK